MEEKRFTSMYDLPNSFNKLFGYFSNISKEPFTVTLKQKGKDKDVTYYPPKKVVVSKNLFRQYNCLNLNCSKCCWKIRDWNIYTPNQQKDLFRSGALKYGEEVSVLVGGKKFNFYVEENIEEVCKHLDRENNLCKIHKWNPIHCALPLIKFKRVRDITYITREYFGRNWNMKCPVKFEPLAEEGLKITLEMMERVKNAAEELGIKTYIKDIILKIECRKIIHTKKLSDFGEKNA